MSDDHELVTAVMARTPGAFEQLIARHKALVWHVVYRMVKHNEDARELSQDVFLRVYQRLHQYRFESSLATWIGRVAFSVASRHLQKKKLPLAEPTHDDDGDVLDDIGDGFDLEAACADRETMQHLNDAIEALPAMQRTLVTLYHLDEMSITEIGMITGLPEGTVKNYLFRARQRLRKTLETRTGVIA